MIYLIVTDDTDLSEVKRGGKQVPAYAGMTRGEGNLK
jgi:hypothetical protein